MQTVVARVRDRAVVEDQSTYQQPWLCVRIANPDLELQRTLGNGGSELLPEVGRSRASRAGSAADQHLARGADLLTLPHSGFGNGVELPPLGMRVHPALS